VAFNRDDAVSYAADHWNTVCDDELIYLYGGTINTRLKKRELRLPDPDSWDVVFLPDPSSPRTKEQAFFYRPTDGDAPTPATRDQFELVKFHEDKGLADCAHYLSKCLQAGGLKGFLHPGVPDLVSSLRGLSHTKTLGNLIPGPNAQQVINTGIFQPGDVIAYYLKVPHNANEGTGYSHSTMYVGDNRITCHTLARFREQYNNSFWPLVSKEDALHWRYTLIHFADDDPPSVSGLTGLIEGWWEVDAGPEERFYSFQSNGVVRFTPHRPANTKHALAKGAAKESGYWYDLGVSLLIFWIDTGVVERWIFGPDFPDETVGERRDGSNVIPITVSRM
jgi:hypothetical protein